jgi:hypothetical protein
MHALMLMLMQVASGMQEAPVWERLVATGDGMAGGRRQGKPREYEYNQVGRFNLSTSVRLTNWLSSSQSLLSDYRMNS